MRARRDARASGVIVGNLVGGMRQLWAWPGRGSRNDVVSLHAARMRHAERSLRPGPLGARMTGLSAGPSFRVLSSPPRPAAGSGDIVLGGSVAVPNFMDPASGVFGEEAFHQLLTREASRATRYQDFFSVCLIQP